MACRWNHKNLLKLDSSLHGIIVNKGVQIWFRVLMVLAMRWVVLYQRNEEGSHVQTHFNPSLGMINRFVGDVGMGVCCVLESILFGVELNSIDRETTRVFRFDS